MKKFDIKNILYDLGDEIVKDMKAQVPIDTGELAREISYKVTNNSLTILVPQYGLYVELGTEPHWAPIKALEGWATRKGINPYAVQRSIATFGTQPQSFMGDLVKIEYNGKNDFAIIEYDPNNKYQNYLADRIINEFADYIQENYTIKINI